MLEYFVKNLPNSTIAKHLYIFEISKFNVCITLIFFFRKRTSQGHTAGDSSRNTAAVANIQILYNAAQSIVLMELSACSFTFVGSCCEMFYKDILNEDLHEMFALTQNSPEWHNARKYRITGSRCYEIFTYGGANWMTKAKKYFWPKSFVNKFIKHGLKYENAARRAFIKNTGKMVTECGMIICPQNKWLGFSPDGIVMDGDDKPVALLEIKCPYAGN